MTTPLDATAFSNPAQSSPAETAAEHAAGVEASAGAYNRSFRSTVAQYQELAGIEQSFADYPSAGTIIQVKDWVAGGDHTEWDYLTPTPSELERAQYAYAQELAGANRTTLLGWLENIPGVEE